MNQDLRFYSKNRMVYQSRCKCKGRFSATKKRKFPKLSEGKPHQYPNPNETTSFKTFQIKYDKKLSLTSKFKSLQQLHSNSSILGSLFGILKCIEEY